MNFPPDPWPALRRAVVEIDAGRDESALDLSVETWRSLRTGDGLRVVAATVMTLALTTGEARRCLRSILPAISIRCAGQSLGGEHFLPAEAGAGEVVPLAALRDSWMAEQRKGGAV